MSETDFKLEFPSPHGIRILKQAGSVECSLWILNEGAFSFFQKVQNISIFTEKKTNHDRIFSGLFISFIISLLFWYFANRDFFLLFLFLADCPDPNCAGHGFCVEGSCVCRKGWRGPNCDQLDHEARQCLPDCSGHGEFDLEAKKCICKGQWTGRDCSKGKRKKATTLSCSLLFLF